MNQTKTDNFINQKTGKISITEAFGEDLAILLAKKIILVHKAVQFYV